MSPQPQFPIHLSSTAQELILQLNVWPTFGPPVRYATLNNLQDVRDLLDSLDTAQLPAADEPAADDLYRLCSALEEDCQAAIDQARRRGPFSRYTTHNLE